jgi:hypothetical protein
MLLILNKRWKIKESINLSESAWLDKNRSSLYNIKNINYCTSGETRTRNPRLRRPVPYPLGHRGGYLSHWFIDLIKKNS